MVTSSQYAQIAPELIRVFIKVLEEGEPQFIAEPAAQVLLRYYVLKAKRGFGRGIPNRLNLSNMVQQAIGRASGRERV